MSKLGELASLIRSKNAGPFELTFDVMFADQATFERVRRSGVLSRESVAKLYRLSANEVRFFECTAALAFKASIPRPFIQGDPGDSDGHGGQQYAPLVDLEIP
ncbi:MAG: hypothetical protein ACI8W7_004092 [Gammaproteobacteria bacterium]|jgi:hypothetical protein